MKDNRLSLFCAAALAFGCSAGVSGKTGTGGSNGSGTGGSTSSGGHGGSSSTGGSNGNGGSSSTGGSSGNTDASLDGACAASTVGAQPVPLDLYFLMDSSKSMNDQTGAGTTKWAAVSSALNTFFTDSGSAGLGVALKYFPDEQSGAKGSCDTATATTDCGSYGPCDYRDTCVATNASTTAVSPLCLTNADCGSQNLLPHPAVRHEQLLRGERNGDVRHGLQQFPRLLPPARHLHSFRICHPERGAGDTPRGGQRAQQLADRALARRLHADRTGAGGSRDVGQAAAEQQPGAQGRGRAGDRRSARGIHPGIPPAECAPSDIPGISTILSGAATGTNPILTFVVGIFNPASAEGMMAPANLKSLAQAGGTSDAVIIDVTGNTVTQQLHDALAKAQTKAIACSYSIPPSTGGTGVDFNKVNVQFTGGTGSSATIGHTGSSSACDKGGWYYDVDPSAGTPTKIIACPSTCTQFNADVSGHVDIVLGCATISVT